jgi:hypothetical protein
MTTGIADTVGHIHRGILLYGSSLGEDLVSFDRLCISPSTNLATVTIRATIEPVCDAFDGALNILVRKDEVAGEYTIKIIRKTYRGKGELELDVLSHLYSTIRY